MTSNVFVVALVTVRALLLAGSFGLGYEWLVTLPSWAHVNVRA